MFTNVRALRVLAGKKTVALAFTHARVLLGRRVLPSVKRGSEPHFQRVGIRKVGDRLLFFFFWRVQMLVSYGWSNVGEMQKNFCELQRVPRPSPKAG